MTCDRSHQDRLIGVLAQVRDGSELRTLLDPLTSGHRSWIEQKSGEIALLPADLQLGLARRVRCAVGASLARPIHTHTLCAHPEHSGSLSG